MKQEKVPKKKAAQVFKLNRTQGVWLQACVVYFIHVGGSCFDKNTQCKQSRLILVLSHKWYVTSFVVQSVRLF